MPDDQWTDQWIVKGHWRILPDGTRVWVKEHTKGESQDSPKEEE